MKSRQINFFILPEDIIEIQSYLKEKDVLFIVQPTFNVTEPLANSIVYPKPEGQFTKVYLTHIDFYNDLIFNKIEKQSYYLIDDIVSPVIEFNRGGFVYDRRKLERARLYYISAYYDKSESLVRKSQLFNDWAIRTVKEIKEIFFPTRINGRDYFFSNRTREWIENNNAQLTTSGLNIIQP